MTGRHANTVFVVILLITLGALALTVVLTQREIAQTADRNAEGALRNECTLLAALVEGAPAARREQVFHETAKRLPASSGRAVLLGTKGELKADAARVADPPVPGVVTVELDVAARQEIASLVRRDAALGGDALFVARAIRIDDAIWGFVRIDVPVGAVDHSVDNAHDGVLLAAAIAFALALLAGFLYSNHVNRQIKALFVIAKEVAAGNHGAATLLEQMNIPAFAPVAQALDDMSHELRRGIRAGTEAKRRLEAVLESMVEGVIAMDVHGRLISVNDVARRLLALPSGNLEGQYLVTFVRVLGVVDGLERSARTGSPEVGEFRVSNPPQDSIVEVHFAALKDAEKNIGGAVAVLHDVTKVRRLENMRREFIANVSHELKTPLTAIQGAAETIVDSPSMPKETIERFLRKIHLNSQRLSQLITDMLELSRIQSGAGALTRENLDLRDIARECLGHFTEQADAKKIALRGVYGANPVMISADRRALVAVADNLLSNAVRYTTEGGEVTIDVRNDGADALLRVSDSGIGIESKHLERIFERFYRVDHSRSRELGGTGLGLAIVKNWVQAHGGTIAVESSIGVGTTFTVSLPKEASGAHFEPDEDAESQR